MATASPTVDNEESGTATSPVAYYGKSSEFGQVLDFIQFIISKDSLRREFDIPHLVVIGRQNMAKTTLINRLIGRYLLPMRRSEKATYLQALTTCPTILNLRYGDCRRVEVTCDSRPDLGINKRVENPDDNEVEEFLRDAAAKLPKEEGTTISTIPINVSFEGPSLTTLTLVDLPGVHFANDNQRMNDVTQKLVLEYIKKNKKSIIVIVSEVGDPTGDSAINLVMKDAPNYKSRTICALTKPDKLRDTDDLGRKVALNESSFTLEENRFIILRGKDGTDPKEKDWDAETTRVKEKEWFDRHGMYSDIPALCGVDRLMRTMISLLAERMVSEIPILVTEMKSRKLKVERALDKLAETEVPENKEGRGALVMKLKQQLIDQLKRTLFNNTTNVMGGEEVRELFKNFHREIFKVDPLEHREDVEIRKLHRKLEGVTAPLGHSSENNQLLELLLHQEFNSTNGLLASPVDQLLPICDKLLKDVEKKMKQIVEIAIDECLVAFPELKLAVKARTIGPIFEAKRSETEQFMGQFIEMQKESVDTRAVQIPLPEEITVWEAWKEHCPKEHTTTQRHTTAAASGLGFGGVASTPQPFSFGVGALPSGSRHPVMASPLMSQLSYLSRELFPENLLEKFQSDTLYENCKGMAEMSNTKKNVARSFNVIKMNVADVVPRCIQFFFVRQLVEGLDRALTVRDLVGYVQEKKEVRDKRTKYRKELASLNDALERTDGVIVKLLTMQKVTD